MILFPQENVVGVFRGFREGGMEFHADLSLPYREEFQSIPMHGQFLLVQLETPTEAILGRIASLSSQGSLSSGSGEEFNIRAMQESLPIPEDIREQYLRYRVNIRVLGVVRVTPDDKLNFVASHRRLPHVGSRVAFLSGDVLREIAGHNVQGATIGHFALGEYFYGPQNLATEEWMQVQTEEVAVNFDIDSLVARRSFIFARAGFGKSNLNKLLFSRLYSETPTVEKRGGRRVPVGTILFDPDGEYFWPDDKGRPGFCDVPGMEDHLVVFTSRRAPSEFYQSFVAGQIRLDIRRLRPEDVVAIALPVERQEQQNVQKLRSMGHQQWRELIDLIYAQGFNAPIERIRELLALDSRQDIEALAARANATRIVRMLHDPASQLMDMIIKALSDGKLCVVDVSQISAGPALVLSGLILRRIFDRNQEQFTAAEPKTIPTIAVVEEAQAVLNERAVTSEPYIQWVKEGRKYDLGAVLVTQQPGSIPFEILSQGDNWFLFHLLSAGDLRNVQAANAHFGQDILSTLLNETIRGQGVFWSSAGGKQYPVPVRVLSFEDQYSLLDRDYDRGSIATYASELRAQTGYVPPSSLDKSDVSLEQNEPLAPEAIDVLRSLEDKSIQSFKNSQNVEKIKAGGVPWGALNNFFKDCLPENLDQREEIAYRLVPKALSAVFGPQDQAWETYNHESSGKTWVRVIQKE